MKYILIILFFMSLNSFAYDETYWMYNTQKEKCVPLQIDRDLRKPYESQITAMHRILMLDEDEKGENWTLDVTYNKKGVYIFVEKKSESCIVVSESFDMCEKAQKSIKDTEGKKLNPRDRIKL